jgi:hypothetical protein
MFSKLVLSIGAALLLSAGVARAEPAPSGDAVDVTESGIPDSIDYRNRTFAGHSPSNEEIDAAEMGNPDSIDHHDRMPVSSKPISDAEWKALESGNPDAF